MVGCLMLIGGLTGYYPLTWFAIIYHGYMSDFFLFDTE